MTDFTMTTDADGIAVITWDCADKSMNVVNWDALRTLDGFIDTVIADETVGPSSHRAKKISPLVWI